MCGTAKAEEPDDLRRRSARKPLWSCATFCRLRKSLSICGWLPRLCRNSTTTKTKPDRNAWSLSLDSDTVTVALAPSMHLLLCLPSLALALAKPSAYLALTANLAWCLAAGRGRGVAIGLTTRKS